MIDLNLLENIIDELYMEIIYKARSMQLNKDFSDKDFHHLNSLIKLHNILTVQIITMIRS